MHESPPTKQTNRNATTETEGAGKRDQLIPDYVGRAGMGYGEEGDFKSISSSFIWKTGTLLSKAPTAEGLKGTLKQRGDTCQTENHIYTQAHTCTYTCSHTSSLPLSLHTQINMPLPLFE